MIRRSYGGGGIWVSTRAYGWFANHYARFGSFHIEDNRIEITGGDWGDGIYVVGRPDDDVADSEITDNRAHDPVVLNNKIQGLFGGIVVVDAENATIQGNRIDVPGAPLRFSLE